MPQKPATIKLSIRSIVTSRLPIQPYPEYGRLTIDLLSINQSEKMSSWFHHPVCIYMEVNLVKSERMETNQNLHYLITYSSKSNGQLNIKKHVKNIFRFLN